MDTFTRLILAFLVSLFSASYSHGYGSVQKDVLTVTSYSFCGLTGPTLAPLQEACAAKFCASQKAGGWLNCSAGAWSLRNIANPNPTMQTFTADVKYSYWGVVGYPSNQVYTADMSEEGTRYQSVSESCPQDSKELASKACECEPGYKPDPQKPKACIRYNCPPAGSYSSVTQPDVIVPTVGTFCMGGCYVNSGSIKASVDGKLYATWPYKSTGQACLGTPDPISDVKGPDSHKGEAAPKCPANQCPGTVNGTAICVPCANTTVPGASTSASGVSNTTPGGPNLPDGGTSNTSTTCTQSTCTTTTTVTDKNGNTVGEAKQEKPKESFCQENPQLSICKDGKWGGSCGAFFCDGDAVQCALSLQVHKSACDWQQLDPDLKAKGDAAIAGGDRPEGHPATSPDARSMSFSSVISTSDVLGGGSCPSDTVIAYAGKSLVIPWSKACSALQMVGNLAMAVCMLAAAFIVFR